MKTSTSEQGHAINIANFETLITYCTGYGDRYNPVKPFLKLPGLQVKLEESKRKYQFTNAQKNLMDAAINERIEAFSDLEKLSTRVTNAFAVSEAPQTAIESLKAINRKIQGPSKRKKPQNDDSEGVQESISTSQQSYDSKLNFFKNLIQYLENQTVYSPNETELNLASLREKYNLIEAKNKAVDEAVFYYNAALNDRNSEMYDPQYGLVQTAKEVKQYVRSIFGAKSPEIKLLSSIEFRYPSK